MIKKYNQYIKEGLSDYLKGPSEEEVLDNLKGLSDSDKIRKIILLGKEYYKYLPDNLTVIGGLYCYYNQLTSLPDNLTIIGDLNCRHNKIKLEVPKTATIEGKIYN